MKKLIILTIILMMLPVVSAGISPGNWEVYEDAGETIIETFTFNNTENVSQTIDVDEWVSVEEDSVDALSSEDKEVTLEIPEDTEPGNYIKYMTFDGHTIPIIIGVLEDDSCNVDIFPTTLSNVKLEQGKTKTREVMVTVPNCYTQSVDLRGINLESNQPPIEMGEMSLGVMNPGDSIKIPVDMDGREVETGTYYETMSFLMYDNNGNRLSVPSVSISVTVTAGVSPITNVSVIEPPRYEVPSEMIINETYEVKAKDVNPNLQIHVIPNEAFSGSIVKMDGDDWIWKVKPVKLEETQLQIYATYKGGVIGNLYTQEVFVKRSSSQVASDEGLKLQFFPKVDDLMNGTELNILVKSNETGVIVEDAKIYVNGKKDEDKSIVVEEGKYYTVSAVYGGQSVEETFRVVEPKLPLSFSVQNPKVGEEVTFVTEDNSTIKIDGNSISGKTYSFADGGTYQITATKQGYLPNTKNITVEESDVEITDLKDEIRLGEENILATMDKDADWEVWYSDESQSQQLLVNGSSKAVILPNDVDEGVGTYTVYVNGETVKSYNVEGFDYKVLLYIIVALGLAIAFIQWRNNRSGGSSGGYGSGSGYGTTPDNEQMIIEEV